MKVYYPTMVRRNLQPTSFPTPKENLVVKHIKKQKLWLCLFLSITVVSSQNI